MKDLIVITAHCPNEEKRRILHNLVIGLQPIRKDYDLLVISHTPITFDVQENVDWVIFDKDNELLKDWKYQNQPWFSPADNKFIQSVFFGSGNTYLTLHKQLIAGYSHAKTFGYKKAHFIEYDAYFTDYTEFYDNSKKLEEYDAILYKKGKSIHDILEFGIGNFHSINIDKLPNRAFYFDREEILTELENSSEKTTEKRTQILYSENNNKVLYKNDELITKNGNILRLIDFHKGEFEMQWAVPYYNSESDEVDFIAWNDSSENECSVIVIVNDENLIKFDGLTKLKWSIKPLGKINEISNIKILINGKLKSNITLNPDNYDIFKKTNYIKYEK